MASTAKWNNIKPLAKIIARMMVFLGRPSAPTSVFFSWTQGAPHNCFSDSISGTYFVFIVCFVSLSAFIFNLSTFCSFSSQSLFSFCFFAFWINKRLSAFLANAVMPVFHCSVFMKFRDFLNFLAMTALFCYDWFRHGFFLLKKLCLEPLQAQYLYGSSYYATSRTFCQGGNLGK